MIKKIVISKFILPLRLFTKACKNQSVIFSQHRLSTPCENLSLRLNLNFLLLLICFPLLFSCFEPEEGCLDIEANNFQLAADRDCSKDARDNCFCTYPSVSLRINHVFDKTNFVTDQVYRTSAGNYLKIRDIQFYISDIQLLLQNDRLASTLDTITLPIQENGQLENKVILDDFHLIQPTTQRINSLITTNQSGSFTQLQFSVGIKSPANTTQQDQLNRSTHVLAIDSMYLESEGYIFNQLQIQPDTASSETIIIQLTNSDSLPRITLDMVSLEKSPGENISVATLEINHAKWFDGINFAESKREIRRKIVTNTKEVFVIRP